MNFTRNELDINAGRCATLKVTGLSIRGTVGDLNTGDFAVRRAAVLVLDTKYAIV